jgi:putative transposase
MKSYDRLTQPVLRRPVESTPYTSTAFGLRCRAAGVQPSMGSVGDAYDNALCESFCATLECEFLDRRRFAAQAEAQLAGFDSIEGCTTRAAATRRSATSRPCGTSGCMPPRPSTRRRPRIEGRIATRIDSGEGGATSVSPEIAPSTTPTNRGRA